MILVIFIVKELNSYVTIIFYLFCNRKMFTYLYNVLNLLYIFSKFFTGVFYIVTDATIIKYFPIKIVAKFIVANMWHCKGQSRYCSTKKLI